MQVLKKLANSNQSGSLATRLRQRRFALFHSLIAVLPRPLTILDVGGSQLFWETMGFIGEAGVHIVLLNLQEEFTFHPGFESVVGDGRDMNKFQDKRFDVVFSNSVIEHLGTFDQQVRMAKEVRRVGKRYWVQTPNRYFPLEPHYLVPFFQFLPLQVRLHLVRHLNLGWYARRGMTKDEREDEARSIRLLTEREMRQLFPDAKIYKERFFGLTKSLTAYGGWAD